MLVGEVYGKTGIKTFNFRAYKEVSILDYVCFKGEQGQWILAQIDSIESLPDGKTIASAKIVGWREKGLLKTPKVPVRPMSLVYSADKDIIESTLKLRADGLYIGRLDANDSVSVYLDAKDLISKHIAILASTGSGKSYTSSIIIEELLEKEIPVVIIDPHGEYASLKIKNDNKDELKLMEKFDTKPKAFNVVEYSPDTKINRSAKQLSFNDKNLSASEIAQICPTKPTSSQMGVLYAALSALKEKDYSLDDLIQQASKIESTAKWNVINLLEMVKKTRIFAKDSTKMQDLVKKGQATIINLRGVAPEIQQMVVYKLLEELFEKRKIQQISPLLLVIEESQNFAPEHEVKASSKIVRTIASEGRKFGLGLMVISQRPARVDKNVLSQCNTQIVMRMQNKNDLKAVSYAEAFSAGVEKEIKNLNPGTALILGQELPMIVAVRVRKSKHGGATVSVVEPEERIEEGQLMVIKGVAYDGSRFGKGKKLLPCWLISADDKNYLISAVDGKLLYKEGAQAKELSLALNEEQLQILNALDKKLSKDELLDKTGLNFANFISALSAMKTAGYISEETKGKDIVYSKNLRIAIKDFSVETEISSPDGELIKAELSEEQALKKAKLLFGEISSIKQIFLPAK